MGTCGGLLTVLRLQVFSPFNNQFSFGHIVRLYMRSRLGPVI